jgi:branched-chain amino acid transport system substrate-binding protein
VTPLTGPLARFGRAGAAALRLWAERSAARLSVLDAHPDSARAMEAAADVRADVWFGPYGSGPAVEAFGAACRPDGPAVWNHGGATSRLAWPEFPRVLNVLAPASTYFDGMLEAARAADPSVRTVAVVHAPTGFGRDVGRGAVACARRLGYEVVEAGQADVLLVAGPFEFELAAARRLLDRPWRVAGFVGAGVEDVLAELGDRREGLVGPSQWHAAAGREPSEGPSAAWFRGAYWRTEGHDPEYPAAQAFAAGVLAARCLADAGSSDPAAVVAAAVALRCDTLLGVFRLDPESGRQVGHQVCTVQWQDGRRRVVWPPDMAERPLRLASG